MAAIRAIEFPSPVRAGIFRCWRTDTVPPPKAHAAEIGDAGENRMSSIASMSEARLLFNSDTENEEFAHGIVTDL